MHPGAALGGNGVEPVIALKHIKIFSFCIIPAGADRVRAGTSRSTCIQVYKKTAVSQDVDRVPIRCKRVLMEKPKWCDPLKAAAAHFQCSGQSELAKWWPLSIENMMWPACVVSFHSDCVM